MLTKSHNKPSLSQLIAYKTPHSNNHISTKPSLSLYILGLEQAFEVILSRLLLCSLGDGPGLKHVDELSSAAYIVSLAQYLLALAPDSSRRFKFSSEYSI